MAARGSNRPFHYYSYVQPVDTSMTPLEIGLSLLAFPFVLLFAGLADALHFVRAWGRGVMAGLGFGSKATPLAIRPQVEAWDGRHEPAYTQYLFGPVWRDVKHTVTVAAGHEKKSVGDRFKKVQKKYFLPPGDDTRDQQGNPIIGVGRLVAIGVGLLLALALLLVAFVAQAAVIGLMWLAGLALIYLLRGIDSVLQAVRHIRITCPSCGRHAAYPSYRCAECGKVQHDVRPGRYGMINRHCRCGQAMPTLLMLGSHQLTAICPHCDRELEKEAGRMPETVLPVFGAAGAGKTQLLVATAMAVRTMLERGGGSVSGADRPADDWLRQTVEPFARGVAVTKTPPAAQHAHALRLEINGRRRVLKMFDAAGEFFQNGERIAEMRYLEANPTFVFVVDPLTVPKLWNALDAGRREKLKDIRAARPPYTVFEATVQSMHRDLKTKLSSSRLAVVVSKADLIRPEVTAAGVGADGSIREWLEGTLELGHLIRSMDVEFSSVGYFLTTATIVDGEVDASIETFLSWVLDGAGMRL
ncbi:DNA-directed RNA polymerase subunit RPC12/RpoP [Actinoplanes tereljensis]|uniref:Double-GTPase 2 domain-containing protein n=1 Tax=Paractinoplanes tereljensis TaxID=571912 RepID=A0A919NYE2_9ACTN|nr:hypothetical protein [Actinoplanes tereljensis]GIF26535.1 hypothetical protein Ate02nite_92650 [Actinoplanes tereljensis]